MSHSYASGKIAADMTSNVTAASTGRILAVRLHNMTNDPGMKDMLSFLIARDTMHQNQLLAALEDLCGAQAFPIPNSFPQEQEKEEFSYAFLGFQADGSAPVAGRWSQGRSMDGKGEFNSTAMTSALGQKPALGAAREELARRTNRCDPLQAIMPWLAQL